MDEPKFIKFAKIITINPSVTIDEYFNVIMMATQKLLWCMKESNEINKMHTEFFKMNLTNSEKVPFAKDLILEWACLDEKL